MKKQYLIFIFIIFYNCSSSVFAQIQSFEDYHPFPYDSVFFELSTPDTELFGGLMPVVKSGDPDDMLLPIQNTVHWVDILKNQNNFGSYPFIVSYESWLGKLSYADHEISIVTAFNDSLKIRTDLLVNTSDTCQFTLGGMTNRQLVVHCDTIVITSADEIKEYSFSVLDENANPISGVFSEGAYDVESFLFRISKNNGILNTPAFFYFPYSEQYHYKAIAENILDQYTLNAYKIFHKNAGDEIHSLYEVDNSGGWGFNNTDQVFYKRICVNEDYNEALQQIIFTYDIWKLEKYYTGGTSMSNPPVLNIIPDYNQIKDTLFLSDYNVFNKALPDGFGNEPWEEGYFFNVDDLSFEGITNNDVTNYNGDSLIIYQGIDQSSHEHYNYRFGHGLRYHNSSAYSGGEGWYYSFHQPVYTKINGVEWGEAIAESFILDIPESVSQEFKLLIENNRLYVQADFDYESARIYDVNGHFIKYISKQELDHYIMIDSLETGVYIFCLWDGAGAHSLKFVKN